MKDLSEVRPWLIQTIAQQLTQVLETMAGESPLAESAADSEPPQGSGLSVWEVRFSSAPGALAYLAAQAPDWQAIGNRVLLAAGLDADDLDITLGTFRETVDQAFSAMAQGASRTLGREVTVTPSQPTTHPANLAWSATELIFTDETSAKLYFAWNSALTSSFLPPPAAPAPAASAPAPAAAVPTAAAAAAPANSRSLDVLYDIELPLSVSFGRAQVQLKDVLKLTTGSIVELNRTVNEPVDLIINNCVVARGEVVVVEGNFGIRIQKVISRQERLRTLY